MPNSETLLSELRAGVLTITLNRPKVNAFNLELVTALYGILREAGGNPQVRCILLTGAGSVFSAGQDVSEMQAAEGQSFRQHLLHSYNPLILQIRRLEKPVIAAINGAAAGAALGVALACDLRIAAEGAFFVVGFAGIGLACDSAVSLLLPALIGLGRATELTFTNASISATQALEWGLVNRVVPDAELPQCAFEWASSLAQGPAGAMGLSKRNFNKAVLTDLEQVLDYEAHNQDIASRGREHKEGISAFLEKRTPNFS